MAWLSKEWSYRYPVLVPVWRKKDAPEVPVEYKIKLPLEWDYFFEKVLPSGADVRITDWTGTKVLQYDIDNLFTAAPAERFINFSDELVTERLSFSDQEESVEYGSSPDLMFVWIYWGNPNAASQALSGFTPTQQVRVFLGSPSPYVDQPIGDPVVLTPSSTGDAIVECRFEDPDSFSPQVVVKPPTSLANGIVGYDDGLNIFWNVSNVRGAAFYTNKYQRSLQDLEIMKVCSYATGEGTPQTIVPFVNISADGTGWNLGVVQTGSGDMFIMINYQGGVDADVLYANLMVTTFRTLNNYGPVKDYPESRTPRFAVKIKIVEPGP